MNLEQTLEALDRAIRVAVYSPVVNGMIQKDDAATLQSLRDSLPQLLADAEAFRKMKERGPVACAQQYGHAGSHTTIDCIRYVEEGTALYALPDTKEGGR